MRFWVWCHYWPQNSQLRAKFANMMDAADYCHRLGDRGYGYTYVDTVTGRWWTNADIPKLMRNESVIYTNLKAYDVTLKASLKTCNVNLKASKARNWIEEFIKPKGDPFLSKPQGFGLEIVPLPPSQTSPPEEVPKLTRNQTIIAP